MLPTRDLTWPGLQPRHVPQLGIEPVTLCFTGQHSIHWATAARARFGSSEVDNRVFFVFAFLPSLALLGKCSQLTKCQGSTQLREVENSTKSLPGLCGSSEPAGTPGRLVAVIVKHCVFDCAVLTCEKCASWNWWARVEFITARSQPPTNPTVWSWLSKY